MENGMARFEDALARTKVITFDCYGTLIDWSAGLRQSFGRIFGIPAGAQLESMVSAYVEIEASVEGQPYKTYREVLAITTERLAKRFDLQLPAGEANLLAQMLPDWKPFADTNEALARLHEKYTLGILSNVDTDLFAGTAKQFEIEFDFVVTAQDVRSYKPAPGHFHRAIEQHATPDSLTHVAQSLFHDGIPAGELGIAYVWINRYNDSNELAVSPLATFPDLRSFADAALI